MRSLYVFSLIFIVRNWCFWLIEHIEDSMCFIDYMAQTWIVIHEILSNPISFVKLQYDNHGVTNKQL